MKTFGIYKHYKTGATYEVLTDSALMEATKNRAVVYRQTAEPSMVNDNQVWIRPFADFHDLIEVESGEFVARFARCSDYPHRD